MNEMGRLSLDGSTISTVILVGKTWLSQSCSLPNIPKILYNIIMKCLDVIVD